MSEETISDPDDRDKIDKLMNFLIEHGCKMDRLLVMSVPGAGRGIFAAETIRPCSFILRLTEDVLITSKTVLRSAVGPAIAKYPGTLNVFDALCIFLMSEISRKNVSPWRPFLDVLPDETSVMAFVFTIDEDQLDSTIALFPPRCREKFISQTKEIDSCRRRVLKVWAEAKHVLPLETTSNTEDERLFRWAWSCVNSRCIFKENKSPSSLFNNAEGDAVALAPFLDMLNHSAMSKADCRSCSITQTFDVYTQTGFSEGEEILICYGNHPNFVLLLEYGFVLKDNPNNAAYLEHDDLRRLFTKANVPTNQGNWKVLSESKIPCPLYETDPEPPWSFMATMKLLSMTEIELSNWRKIYDCTSFDDLEIVCLAKKVSEQYLEELQHDRPSPDEISRFQRRFQSAIAQIWQDEISIVSETIAFLTRTINERNGA